MKQFTTLRTLAATAALAAGVLAGLPVQSQGQQSDLVLFGPASNPGGLVGFIQTFETNATEFFPAFLPAPANIPNIGIVLYEDAAQTVLSDQLWVQNGFWYFASDPSLINFQSFGINQVGGLTETGVAQDVSSFFGLPTGSMQVLSDVDVPEPASGLFLGLSGGLWFCLRRRHARRA